MPELAFPIAIGFSALAYIFWYLSGTAKAMIGKVYCVVMFAILGIVAAYFWVYLGLMAFARINGGF